MRKGTVRRPEKDSMFVTGFVLFLAISLLAVCGMAMAGPVPDTGQTKCYNDAAGSNEIPCPQPGEPFYGQDAQYNINPQSYTKLDAQGNDLPDSADEWIMVRDNVTELVWEVKTDDESIHDRDNMYTWHNTENFINALNSENFGGYSDWRMPTVKELSSIVNSGVYKPTINTAYFPDTMSSGYWSSTTHVGYTDVALLVGFDYGGVSSYDKSYSYYVRAVRGGLHIPGDVNNDRRIDLADVVLALQVSVSMTPVPVICKGADVNEDGKIGIEEAVYGLQWVAGLRPQTIEQIEILQSTKSRTLSPDVAETELNELVAGNNTFALNLYQAIRTNTGNLFYSPYSISSALAMTYGGARNETESQMANTLNFTLPQDRLHPAFNALDLELADRGEGAEGQDGEGFRLNIANSIWGQKDYSFLPEFLDVLAENYGAGLSLLDFYNAPEDSRVIINTWVSEQTEDKINDLIPQGAISYLTRLVLTNAIYFNAAWNLPFDEELTMDGQFYLFDGSQITVPMMSQTEYFGYTEGDGYKAVELLYDGEELSMVVLCPEAGGFEEFENTITPDRLNAIVNDLSSVNVQLKLPKFTYESGSISLKKALTQMGMPVPFSSSADFSGINGTRNLFISDIFHKAFVSVDEAGTEAAAATAVIVKVIAIPTPPVEVTIDRPFIFLIRDIKTQAILFIGRIVNPIEQ